MSAEKNQNKVYKRDFFIKVASRIFQSYSSISLILVLSYSSLSYSLPIDWNGVFGVETQKLSNTCRTTDKISSTDKTKTGTQALVNDDCDANFQTYTFKLNPNIIINDGVSLKGELSTGYIRGNFAGTDSSNSQDGSGNNAYFFTTPSQRSALNINQMYMELFAETALMKMGRFTKDFGMGIIFNGGNESWDRFLTSYDGIEAEMKIGNFSITPHFAKISSLGDPTSSRNGEPAGHHDVSEMGVIASYDNKNKDLLASVYYAKRTSERRNTLYQSSTTATDIMAQENTAVTIIEPYISKKWEKLSIELEASLQSGNYGHVYNSSEESNFSAQAYVTKVNYKLNPKWSFAVTAGQVSGDDGNTGDFEATYLHPNFHVADLMFRYNYASINEGEKSFFDSSITNTRFLKLAAAYETDKWLWKTAIIYAQALETAKANEKSYHHEENYRFDANNNQSENYGTEFDFGFDYQWNPSLIISGYYAYWMVGDYYSFTNTANSLELSNVHGGGLRATLSF